MGTPLTQWLQLVGWVLLATTLICLSATGVSELIGWIKTPSPAINLTRKISDQEHQNQSGMTCYIDPEVFLECISSAIQLDF